VFATVECEAVVFGCRVVRPALAVGVPAVLALPGADHVLASLPAERWALLSDDVADEVVARFRAIELPAPPVVVSGAFDATHHRAAIAALGVDPAVSLCFEDTADGITAARAAGLQVVGVATTAEPAELDDADLVVPSLLSVRVLGAHPFIVLEVDAVPDLGSGAGRRR
jgi:beta-phosphoglucomutase-like phosphatase (HAD superfamily)